MILLLSCIEPGMSGRMAVAVAAEMVVMKGSFMVITVKV